jgi:uncharacterized membrane protein YdjX (TVP38/TMEM64 family)
MRSSPPAEAFAARSIDPRVAAWRLSALAAALIVLFAVGLLLAPHSAVRLRRDVSEVGAWAPLAIVAIYAMLSCAFVPGSALAGASGLLFGAALGTGLAIVSATLGACLAFLAARLLARRSCTVLARGRVLRVSERIEARGFVAVLYARIAPAMPFALISYAAGLTGIGIRDFAAATALGAAPRAFAYATLGGSIGNYSSPQALVALGVLAVMTVGGAGLLWRARVRTRARSGG